ncbi:MAG: transcriptional repressor NrdR [Candidatus Altiarchaeota archaeon]|nr:transcriptional repressor NrdR [Candidatus Altiarchaeota archaeon]
MRCPYCSYTETRVVDKRDLEDSGITRRRRECLKCSKRFNTYERVETIELTVVKKDGKREQFDREKLLKGVIKACEKRPISREDMEKLVSDVEMELRAMDETEISSSAIGELVMKKLKKLDKVAYIRFASVYRDFADLDTFEREVRKLLKK